MTRKTNVVMNFALNALIFYGIGRKLKGHQTGVRLGLAGGLFSALVASRMDSQPGETDD
jgi:hypothetical protein